ncbi:HEAT repeat domain-containing protein [Streptomyces justiciae]|uniref:HEAT repeat domain-containing protein n=1 Tax=Streptomyces justiciae TaxID=2780140 RepID=UPI00188184B4|nr:hypothetical protein [Streptomyces justiciae]MBE8474639.1 hypothetical protein [Streptomyces justiciae]MCW8379034.1 hypothetical protein [Streptomyces justiciae]
MFAKRRARREQERQEDLAARIVSPVAEVRVATAREIAGVRDTGWAIRELARALHRESSPAAAADIAEIFCDAVCRDRSARERVESMFVAHADDPAALVRAWTAFLAGFGAGAALETVDDEVAAEVTHRMRRVGEQGCKLSELSGTDPDSFPYQLTFTFAVALLHDTVRRHTPLTSADADRARRHIRAALKSALAHPVDSDERQEVLTALCERPEDESWSDRQTAALCIEEALDLCRSAEDDLIPLGLEALDITLHGNEVYRHDAVRETLDGLRAPEQDPIVFSKVLSCYPALHADRPLDAPPVEMFLAALAHTDSTVRASAAAGLDTLAPGLPQETRAVAALIHALDHDPDVEVVRCASYALATIACTEEANSRAASTALAKLTDSADPALRLASIEGALNRREPGAFDRLTAELRRPDVEAMFVSHVGYHCERTGGVAEDVGAEWARLLEQLRLNGWADRPGEDEDGDDTDPSFRALLLNFALKSLPARA